jgi:hypothetical protein
MGPPRRLLLVLRPLPRLLLLLLLLRLLLLLVLGLVRVPLAGGLVPLGPRPLTLPALPARGRRAVR